MGFLKKMFSQENMRLLVLGLDAAGKTTFLNLLKVGELVLTQPTIGFNVETIEYKSVQITAWDVGGQKRIRDLWHHYFDNTDGVIFIVDSTDTDRLTATSDGKESACEELWKLMNEDRLRQASFLILANKQDQKSAIKPSELAALLQLNKQRSHPWFLQGCSCTTRDGIYEGLDWLIQSVRSQRDRRTS